MGPTLAMLLRRAAAGHRHAASRWSDAAARSRLERAGVRTVEVDLLDRDALERLPEAATVYLPGGNEVRGERAPGPHVGDERLRARPGRPSGTGRAASSCSRPATSTRSSRSADGGAARGHAAGSGRRVRAVVPRARADVSALQRPATALR